MNQYEPRGSCIFTQTKSRGNVKLRCVSVFGVSLWYALYTDRKECQTYGGFKKNIRNKFKQNHRVQKCSVNTCLSFRMDESMYDEQVLSYIYLKVLYKKKERLQMNLNRVGKIRLQRTPFLFCFDFVYVNLVHFIVFFVANECLKLLQK